MKSTSSLVIPMFPNTSAMTGNRLSASLCSSSLRTFCDWANEAMETGRMIPPAALTGTPCRRRSRHPARRSVGNTSPRRGKGSVWTRPPTPPRPASHADLVGGDLLQEAHEREVRPVEEDLGADVGDLDGLAGERHIDYAVGGHGPRVAEHHVLRGGHPVGRARAPARHVDLAARLAPLSQKLAPLESPEELRLGDAGSEFEVQPDRRGQRGHRSLVTGCIGHQEAPPSRTNASMSAIEPMRSATGRNLAVTRAPVAMLSGPGASTAWSMPVSAPSNVMSAQAKGVCRGCLRKGWDTHAHESMTCLL